MKKETRELLLGILILVFGAVYFYLTLKIPRKGGIDARFVPLILSSVLGLLGILQTASALRLMHASAKTASSEVQPAREASSTDSSTVIKTIALIILYIALLNAVGFVIMSALYLFFQFIVLTPVDRKKNYLVYAIIAAASSVIIYLIFRFGFDLMLPSGVLK